MTVALLPNGRQQFFDGNGQPLVGGQVFTYIPGGFTPKTSYSDYAGVIPNTNPITLDALGSATIWGPGYYRQIVNDKDGNLVWDDVTLAPSSGAPGSGTVTSIDVSGGTTGLITSGGPVTSSGTITLAGTLALVNGGTGSAVQNFVDLTTTQAVIAGVKTFTGQLIGKGTTTNDNAAAGYIGEYISSTVLVGAAVSLTTTTAADVTSISLTAGDWDVRGSVFAASSGATAINLIGWISTTSATLPASPNSGGKGQVNPPSYVTLSGVMTTAGQMRLLLATTTTVYLGAYSSFTGGTGLAYGFIGARRAR